jgi:integrase
MSKAWIYQDDKQVKKRGEEKASWYVGWLAPDGARKCKSCGPGEEGKRNAEKLRKKREAELIEGTYDSAAKRTWADFRKDYEKRIAEGLDPRTRLLTFQALDNFERLVKPVKMCGIKTQTIDDFIRKRRAERGKKKGSTVSPATVNKDLRHIRAVLTIAVEWGDLKERPRFRMVKEPKKLVTFVTGDHFAAIYGACDEAKLPRRLPYPASDWWRGLLAMAYMTGWRISELLAFRREDLDLEEGTAITLAEDNKGDRDDKVKLHPFVIDHLKKLASFEPTVFPWPHDRRTLDDEFDRIQKAAGIDLTCRRKHEHTEACRYYGFHDLRRAFATQNAPRLTADALQKLMRHKSYTTTQRYISMSTQLDEAVDRLFVPDVGAQEKKKRKGS